MHLALTALSRNGLYNEYSCSLTASGNLKWNRFFFPTERSNTYSVSKVPVSSFSRDHLIILVEENKRGDLFEATSLLDSHQLLDLLKSTNPDNFALSVAAAFPILYLLIEFVLQTEVWLSSCFVNLKLENNLFTCKKCLNYY